MRLNCDLGEISLVHDQQIMPFIDQANIACGGHAGDETSIEETVELALKHNVAIGAHPSYPDRENFGRVSMTLTPEQLQQTFSSQVKAIISCCQKHQTVCHYVKPHGALYNDMMKDTKLFTRICHIMSKEFPATSLMIQALPNIATFQGIADQFNVKLLLEAFADRRYLLSGLLVPRKEKGAVIEDKASILEQVKALCEQNTVVTITRQAIHITADTLCVHGDSQHALAWVKQIRQYLNEPS